MRHSVYKSKIVKLLKWFLNPLMFKSGGNTKIWSHRTNWMLKIDYINFVIRYFRLEGKIYFWNIS